jgi:steroid 5-alpha reductase family enzyme
MYPLVNFSGIHLFPTVLVFLGNGSCIFCDDEAGACKHSLAVVRRFVLCIAATLIEFIADEQQRSFKRKGTDERIFVKPDSGSFRAIRTTLVRFPSGGEFTFMALPLMPPVWTIAGPVAMTLLFVFISIPMMEKHMIEKGRLMKRIKKKCGRWFRGSRKKSD